MPWVQLAEGGDSSLPEHFQLRGSEYSFITIKILDIQLHLQSTLFLPKQHRCPDTTLASPHCEEFLRIKLYSTAEYATSVCSTRRQRPTPTQLINDFHPRRSVAGHHFPALVKNITTRGGPGPDPTPSTSPPECTSGQHIPFSIDRPPRDHHLHHL